MNFGERLIEARKLLGYNQNDFAKELDIASQSLARYEKNKVKPSIEFIGKLTEVFSINSNWLISGRGETLISTVEFNYRKELINILDTYSDEKIESLYKVLKTSA